MRDIIICLVLVGLMPSCFKRPFVGLCVFSWLAYMRVQDLSWGFAKEQRWSFAVAALMYSGWLFSKDRKAFFQKDDIRNWAMILMVALLGIGVLMSVNATSYAAGVQRGRYIEFGKIVLVALFTTGLVRDRERLRIMVWIIGLSLGFYGVKSGIGGIFSGGAPILIGPGGMLADNNDLAMALAMGVPILFILGWTERREELRKAFWFCLPLTILAVGLTQSRGGFLSVSAAIGVLIWRSRNRFMGIGIGVLLGMIALLLAPKEYTDRLSTISAPTEEGSAASRLRAWGIATNMALDNPWFGVGFGKFPQHYLEYCDDPSPGEKAGTAIIVAHSSYFQVWAEAGSLCLGIYGFLILSSLWTCWRIRKEARQRYFSSWIINYATMFEATMMAFVVGAAFLNRAHFDLFYHWVALIVVFSKLAREEMRDEHKYPTRGIGTREPVRYLVPGGFGPRTRASGFRRVATS
ncbi:MAG: putative O-glycosylation ligase (exosortase A-associated) [Planctomycetota bacterium]|jgi:probable O-glycosylation ligase (exosortase A-associated)